MEDQKKILKQLIKSARREFSEKRPLNIKILKIKDRTILKKGILPSLVIKQHQAIQFIVLVEYFDQFRIYLFSLKGILLEGKNLSKESPDISKILSSSQKLYQIPKKE